MSPIFSPATPEVWELLTSLFASEMDYLVCVACLYMIKPRAVVSCWRLM